MKTLLDVTREGFEDELVKISGELQGHTRIGRRPLSVETLLSKERSTGEKVSDIVKTGTGAEAAGAAGRLLSKKKLLGAGVVSGAGLYHVGRQANEDRKLGRQVRRQQG